MTFSARTFQGMTQGTPVPFSIGLSNNSIGLGVRSAGFTLVSDGTITKTPTGGGSQVTSDAWYSPAPTTGAATGVWCKFVINTSSQTTLSGSSTNTVISVSGAGLTFTSDATNHEGTGTFTITFYGDSGGTNRLATATGSWDVGYTP
jgi:hypothetical protein